MSGLKVNNTGQSQKSQKTQSTDPELKGFTKVSPSEAKKAGKSLGGLGQLCKSFFQKIFTSKPTVVSPTIKASLSIVESQRSSEAKLKSVLSPLGFKSVPLATLKEVAMGKGGINKEKILEKLASNLQAVSDSKLPPLDKRLLYRGISEQVRLVDEGVSNRANKNIYQGSRESRLEHLRRMSHELSQKVVLSAGELSERITTASIPIDQAPFLAVKSAKGNEWLFLPGSELGSGGYGKVGMAQNLETGEILAVKQMKLDDEVQPIFNSEVVVQEKMGAADHAILTNGDGSKTGYLFMPLLEKKTGEDVVSELKTLPAPDREKAVIKFAQESIKELAKMHSRGIYHGDIKPANIMFNKEGSPRFIDFGTATVVKETSIRNLSGFSEPYCPPELFAGKGGDLLGNAARDIWALGITLYEITTSERPFGLGDESVGRFKAQNAVQNNPLDLSMIHDDTLRALLQGLLSKDPKQRITAKDAHILLPTETEI